MANGRHGGKRAGAGRKPKVDEVKKAEKMDAIGNIDAILEKCYALAIEGDMNAIKFWIDHRLGKAKESKDIEITGEGVKQYIIKGAKGNINK